MPSTLSLDSDPTIILKPSQPIRRRSTRLSAAIAKASTESVNGTTEAAPIKRSVSTNGHAIKASDSIEELEERPTTIMTAESAAPNGNGSSMLANGFSHSGITEGQDFALPKAGDVRESPRPAPLTNAKPAKPKIDWEVPRKALHSSIGESYAGIWE